MAQTKLDNVTQAASNNPGCIAYAEVILLSVSLFVRAVVAICAPGVLWPDSLHYYHAAAALPVGEALWTHEIYHGPLYPWFLGSFLLFGQTPAIGFSFIIFQHLISIIALLLLYRLGSTIVGPKVSFAASILMALHPVFLYYGSVVQTEVLFVAYFALALLHFLRVTQLKQKNEQHRSWFDSYFTNGILWSAVVLTRPVGQLFVFAVVGILLWTLRAKPKFAVASVAKLLVGYFVLIAPWLAINHQTYNFWGVSRGQGLNLYFTVYDLAKIEPVVDSKVPEVKRLYDRFKHPTVSSYFKVYNTLRTQGAFTRLESDKAMWRFALEGLLSSPWQYAKNTLLQELNFFVAPRNSIEFCLTSSGSLYACAEPGKMLERPAFPNRPFIAAPHWLFSLAHGLLTWGRINAGLLSLFAFCGIANYLRKESPSVGVVVVIAAIGYFSLITSCLNIYEDRYRLPVDFFLFLFGCYAVESIFQCICARRKKAPTSI